MSLFSKIFTTLLVGTMVGIPAFLSFNGGLNPASERDLFLTKHFTDCPEEQRDENNKCKNLRNSRSNIRRGSRGIHNGK